MNEDEMPTRQQLREQRQQKKRDRIAKHGKNLSKVYKDAVAKRQKPSPAKP